MRVAVSDAGTQLDADPTRLALRLFLPGEDTYEEVSRVDGIAARLMDIPEADVRAAADRIIAEFRGDVDHLSDVLARHASTVSFQRTGPDELSPERALVMGAAFTLEYAVEGAALCNPSPVPHPDQSNLEPGQLRVAVALRGIGEGHISSIEFIDAIIGPGERWKFGERMLPIVPPKISEPHWVREHFQHLIATEFGTRQSEATNAVARSLPECFTPTDVENSIAGLPPGLAQRHDAARQLDVLRTMVGSAYAATFPKSTHLSQRVLSPVTHEERNGIEDPRFVLCTYPNGETAYRATYTAYDGRTIAPRLIISPDLRTFEVHRLAGSAARNKGMALFPRHVHGRLFALTRSDGETLGVAESQHGRVWGEPVPIHTPTRLWEIIQTGNCGSPIETDAGWLVLTHGVGPMRRYSIGCLLLDLDDPRRVVATLDEPLIEPGEHRAGYVPNVVYSCGGLTHDGRLWLPYGIGDNRIRVASCELAELLDAMTPVEDAPVGEQKGVSSEK